MRLLFSFALAHIPVSVKYATYGSIACFNLYATTGCATETYLSSLIVMEAKFYSPFYSQLVLYKIKLCLLHSVDGQCGLGAAGLVGTVDIAAQVKCRRRSRW